MPAWKEYVDSGAWKVLHLRPPKAAYEDGCTLPLAVCEFPSLQAAIDARESEEYVKDVLAVSGKPLEKMVVRNFRIIEAPMY